HAGTEERRSAARGGAAVPPGAGPGGAGGADPAVPRRTQDAGDRKRVPGARADHGQAAGVPASDAIGSRLAAVHGVVCLVFNEGYAATGGDQVVRAELCSEAIWLGLLLHPLLPDDAETAPLLALMLLHHSRAPVRQGLDGRPVPLAEQDRARWDHEMIREGVAQLDAAIVRGSPGAYQLQAAIAALHARAASFEETDWAQIATLYGALARRAPSPVVEVNRAVSVGMADGPRAGLAALEPVLASGPLDGYAPLHAAHADLLDRAGDREAAAVAWARADLRRAGVPRDAVAGIPSRPGGRPVHPDGGNRWLPASLHESSELDGAHLGPRAALHSSAGRPDLGRLAGRRPGRLGIPPGPGVDPPRRHPGAGRGQRLRSAAGVLAQTGDPVRGGGER